MTKSLPQKPHFLKIIPPLQNSIVVKDDPIAWNNPWHYHPEVELIHCIRGKGTNFIGNSIRSIEEGEILLIGKNVPHTRQRDSTYYKEHTDDIPASVVIQFREDFLGEQFLDVPEFSSIKDLLQRSLRGIKFTGTIRDKVSARLIMLRELTPALAILELLSVLYQLANTNELIYLNNVNYISTAHEKSSQKINCVYNYTVQNFREQISLQDVAALTNHTASAFCRYFKTRTRKSYFEYLTEVRIAYACELLMQDNLDVTQICYSSGFNNLSHFHKQFKRLVRLTPTQYREQGRKKVPI